MTNENVFDKEKFATLLTLAQSILKATPYAIEKQFAGYPIQCFRYIRQGIPELIMDIRLERLSNDFILRIRRFL